MYNSPVSEFLTGQVQPIDYHKRNIKQAGARASFRIYFFV